MNFSLEEKNRIKDFLKQCLGDLYATDFNPGIVGVDHDELKDELFRIVDGLQSMSDLRNSLYPVFRFIFNKITLSGIHRQDKIFINSAIEQHIQKPLDRFLKREDHRESDEVKKEGEKKGDLHDFHKKRLKKLIKKGVEAICINKITGERLLSDFNRDLYIAELQRIVDESISLDGLEKTFVEYMKNIIKSLAGRESITEIGSKPEFRYVSDLSLSVLNEIRRLRDPQTEGSKIGEGAQVIRLRTRNTRK